MKYDYDDPGEQEAPVMEQLELELEPPWPYTFAQPLEVVQVEPGLSLADVMPWLGRKGEFWAYAPATGRPTRSRPVEASE